MKICQLYVLLKFINNIILLYLIRQLNLIRFIYIFFKLNIQILKKKIIYKNYLKNVNYMIINKFKLIVIQLIKILYNNYKLIII